MIQYLLVCYIDVAVLLLGRRTKVSDYLSEFVQYPPSLVVLQGATGIAEIIRVINESKSRMTQLKQELAASTNYFRHGYQDENVLLPMVLEGGSNNIG